MLNAETIPFNQIVVGDRLRKSSPAVRDHIEKLAASIKEVGLICPLIVDENNVLIDGGCRYAALELLAVPEVLVIRRSLLSPEERTVLEIEANLRRMDLTWQEKVIGIYKVHQTKTSQFKEWGLRATGSLVNASHAYVRDALFVAKYLIQGDTEIENAETFAKAQDLLRQRRESEVIAYRAAITATGEVHNPTPVAAKATPSGIISVTLGTPSQAAPAPKTPATPAGVRPPTTIPLSTFLHNVSCHDFMASIPASSIDIIVTDIPYGIDMANLEDMAGIEQMISTHQVDENIEQMLPFLRGAYRVLKPNTYCCFFFAPQHQEKLTAWAREVGFSPLDWNLLWLKPHSCKNQAAHTNPTKSYEPVMILKKGSPTLQKPMNLCHLEVDGIPDKKLQSNPFAKPLRFLNEMIFSPMAIPGTVCYDPYAGEGSILRAAVSSGLRILGTEIDTDRFPRLVERMKSVYRSYCGADTLFT